MTTLLLSFIKAQGGFPSRRNGIQTSTFPEKVCWVFLKTGMLVSLTDDCGGHVAMLRTDCSGETRLALHVPSS